MLTIEKDFDTFFKYLSVGEKQERFNSLIKEKNLSLDDLNLIFQTIRPKDSGADSEIWRIRRVNPTIVNEVVVNKGAATEESPILSTKQYWTLDGEFIGETINHDLR